ncbi:MAG: isoprenyl transferase [Eubacteriaceae bacterium]|jgi:undecaprenyl diphosphate synthase|nr:isoprenyl transferase [Eubacteriaceae bacterium]
MLDINRMPVHVAIIMDGNGRWAEKRKLPRVMGHNAGMKSMTEIVRRASDLGIKYLTVYAFSTENWKRSKEEVSGIFKLLVKYVDLELDELCRNNVRVRIFGDYEGMGEAVKDRLDKTLGDTKDNTGLEFNICLDYGSRDEMTKAVRAIAREVKDGELKSEDITEETISAHLFTGLAGVPDPDVIIRTSGEERLSNFLLWQCAYSEMIFTPVLWPDYTPEEFEKSLEEFQSRDRRFGGRKETK